MISSDQKTGMRGGDWAAVIFLGILTLLFAAIVIVPIAAIFFIDMLIVIHERWIEFQDVRAAANKSP